MSGDQINVLKMLAHPIRMRCVELIINGITEYGDLLEEVSKDHTIAAAGFSRHIKKLLHTKIIQRVGEHNSPGLAEYSLADPTAFYVMIALKTARLKGDEDPPEEIT